MERKKSWIRSAFPASTVILFIMAALFILVGIGLTMPEVGFVKIKTGWGWWCAPAAIACTVLGVWRSWKSQDLNS